MENTPIVYWSYLMLLLLVIYVLFLWAMMVAGRCAVTVCFLDTFVVALRSSTASSIVLTGFLAMCNSVSKQGKETKEMQVSVQW